MDKIKTLVGTLIIIALAGMPGCVQAQSDEGLMRNGISMRGLGML